MANTSSAREVIVRFVSSPDGASSQITEAFEVLKEEGGSICTWFRDADCFTVKHREKNVIYVFQDFGTPAFEHLLSLGNRIYGPLCILGCLKQDESLPKNPPIFSFAMLGLIVSCSNFSKADRDEIHRKVQWMSGTVSRDFHEGVTHLVAGQVGSKKYTVAANLRKQIMSKDWVEAVWNCSKNSFIQGNDPAFVAKYRCPLFLGSSVTVSGLDTKEREQIRDLVVSEGGKYSGEMKLGECTHLILNDPQGQKYTFAKKHSIHIVRPKWISDSITAGYCLEEHLYKVSEGKAVVMQTSTPTTESGKTETKVRLSTVADISAICPSMYVNETGINSTAVVNFSLQVAPSVEQEALGRLNNLDVSGCKHSQFLEGCKIFISGLNSDETTKVKKIINKGAGVRLDSLSEQVTHVVIGRKNEKDLMLLKDFGTRPHIVNLLWLLDSLSARCTQPEQHYYCGDIELGADQVKPSKRKLVESVTPQPPAAKTRRSTSSDKRDGSNTGCSNMRDILSQYLQESTDPPVDQSSTFIGGNNDMTCTSMPPPPPVGTGVEDMETQDPTQADDNTVLSGQTFMIAGFNNQQTRELEVYIRHAGGQVLPVTSRAIADYGIVPILGHQLERSVGEIVTNTWLQLSVESGTLLPVSSNVLFSPIVPKVVGAQPLKDCVVCISGYLGAERDTLLHIAELLGALCQEYFVRRAMPERGLLASTHLVVSSPASGSKYEAALKWGIPAISSSWLVQCAKESKRLLEKNFVASETQGDDSHACREESTADVSANNQAASSTDRAAPLVSGGLDDSTFNRSTIITETSMNNLSRNTSSDRTMPLLQADSDHNTMAPAPMDVGPCTEHTLRGSASDVTPKVPVSDDYGWETPSKFCLPGVKFVPKFDLEGALKCVDEMKTPITDRSRRKSLPLGDEYYQQLCLANARFGAMSTTTPKTPTIRHSQTVESPAVFHMEPPKPLSGLVMCVAKKLTSKQAEYNKICAALGADYKWIYDQTVTHFIFQGKQNDANKEFRTAREQKKFIVCPGWLLACQQENRRVDEIAYPHTLNLSMAIALEMTNSQRRVTRATKTSETLSSSCKENLPSTPTSKSIDSVSGSTITGACTPSAVDTAEVDSKAVGMDEQSKEEEKMDISLEKSKKESEDLIKGLEKLMEHGKATNTKKWGRRNTENNLAEEFDGSKGTKSSSGGSGSSPTTTRSASIRRFQHHVIEMSEPSQQFDVIWDDPLVRKNQEEMQLEYLAIAQGGGTAKTKALKPPVAASALGVPITASTRANSVHIARPVTTGAPVNGSIAACSGSLDAAVAAMGASLDQFLDSEMDEAPKPPPVFLLSGLQPQEKDDFGALIEELGGKCVESANFDPKCTHLIVEAPSRNEKFLASIAAGKWILHKSYLEACRSSRSFVNESDYEWASSSIQPLLASKPMLVKLALAAKRWRCFTTQHKQAGQLGGAFSGWKALLMIDKRKDESFRRVLQAGGAVVIPNQPLPQNLSEITHAFVDPRRLDPNIQLELLAAAGTHCCKPEYISDYLSDDPPPDPQQHYVVPRQGLSQSLRKRPHGVTNENENQRIKMPRNC